MANKETLHTPGVRWLVTLMLVPSIAAAEFVVEIEPGMLHACPQGKTWNDVKKCLAKHGRSEIVKTVAGAKLVRLDQQEDKAWVDGGLYLYVERFGEWRVAGAFFGRGSDYQLLGFAPFTVGKHTGHRIDIGQASPIYVQIDGATTKLGLRRSQQTMFCGGLSKHCLHTTTTCEVLVRGGAFWAFLGKLAVNGNEVTITGDRRAAGPFCAQAEKQFLGWPQ